jgi:hypothetical protein
MQKVFRFFLTSDRNRRRLVVVVVLWLLRLLRDAEHDEMERNSDVLDSLDLDPDGCSHREYEVIETQYNNSVLALRTLESAIEDIEFAY